MRLKSFLSLAIISIILLSSAAAAGTTPSVPDPVILHSAIRGLFTTNPLIQDLASQRILSLIYEGATIYHPETGEILPYIAVGSANVSGMAMSWDDCAVGNFGYSPMNMWSHRNRPELIIFYDFEGVYWHDGEPMGIRDIMFSLHAHATHHLPWLGHPLKDLAGSQHGNYSQTQWLSVSKVWQSGDRAALRFVLQEPRYSVLEEYLSSPILPYHIWGSRKSGQDMDGVDIWCDPGYDLARPTSWQPVPALAWENPTPVGSGPFAWAGRQGNVIKLSRWERHFHGPGFSYDVADFPASQPAMDGVWLWIYSDEEKAMADLESGKLDLIAWDMPMGNIFRFPGHLQLGTRFLRGARPVDLIFNMNRRTLGYDTAWGSEDIGKPLRKAMAHCVDRDGIRSLASLLVNGESLALYREWGNVSAPQYGFDPQEAINVLRRAGYLLQDPATPPGKDNHWLNPDGSAIGSTIYGYLEIMVPEQEQEPILFNVANMIANDMRSVGINVGLMPLSTDLLWDRLFDGNFDVCIVEQAYRISALPSSGDDAAEPGQDNRPPGISLISPSDGSTGVAMWRPTLNVRVNDPDSDRMNVRFYWADTDRLIGAVYNVQSGNVATVECPNLLPATTYQWYATVEDYHHSVRSSIWKFTTERGFTRSTGEPEDTSYQDEAEDGLAPNVVPGTRSKMDRLSVGREFPRMYLHRPENYYFSLFHSENTHEGPNVQGYRNRSHDSLIELAMYRLDRGAEMALTRDALASIAYDVPRHNLYHNPRFEVFSTERFHGLVDDGSGSLLNRLSMVSVRPREVDSLYARFVSTPLTLSAGTTFQVKIRVTDREGEPVESAHVALDCSSGVLSERTGLTDTQGYFLADFIPPDILPGQDSGTAVMIELAPASKEGFEDSPGRILVFTVFPKWVMPLSVSLDVAQDVVSVGGITQIDIRVLDPRGLPLVDASVSVGTEGAPLVPDITTGLTDDEGRVRVVLRAGHVDIPGECLVTVSASRIAYVTGSGQASLMVLPVSDEPPEVDNNIPAWAWSTVPVAAFLLLAAYLWRRKRNGRC